MRSLIVLALVATAVTVATWAVLLTAARRLPPGRTRELLLVLPSAVQTIRRLRRDPRVPRRAKVAVAAAALWVLCPIDLVPDVLPVVGLLDDVIVVLAALRYAARRVPPEVLSAAWPGDRAALDGLLRRRPARRRLHHDHPPRR